MNREEQYISISVSNRHSRIGIKTVILLPSILVTMIWRLKIYVHLRCIMIRCVLLLGCGEMHDQIGRIELYNASR
jgi:hypothetical protein